MVVLTVLAVGGAILALGMGAADISAGHVLSVIARRLRLIEGADVTALDDRIVWQLRTPRVLAALAVGAMLAMCGVILQSLTRNELADPYLLGISSGASVGVVTLLVFGISLPWIPQALQITTASFAGALLALLAVLALATGPGRSLPPARTILAGVAVAQLCAAFTSLSIMVFGERDIARSVMAWTLGSLAGVRWEGAALLLIVTVSAVVILLFTANTLDAFAFGEVSARSLGINVNRARWLMLAGTALVTAATVAYVGPIGFVGLTIPHLVRMVIGPAHRSLLPISALAGAVLLLWSDTAARAVQPSSEIPIGVVTAVIGAPVLVFLLRRQARTR